MVFHVEPLVREVAAGEYEHVFGSGHALTSWLDQGKLLDQLQCPLDRPEDLFRFLDRTAANDRCTWIYAHNLAYQLTLLDFWRYISRGGERFLWCVLEDPPTIITTLKGRRLRKWVDTANYWRMPLWQLISQIGSNSLQQKESTRNGRLDSANASTVAKGLALLILGAIRAVSSLNLSAWQCTASSLAWHAFRKCYNTTPIYVHDHKESTALERKSLYGGRLQTYRLGQVPSPVTALDVNSLYPYVMASQPQPSKLVSWQEKASVRELHQALSGYHCVAEVRVMAPAHPLPVRGRGQVEYSQADQWYCLSDPELSAVVRNGMVSAVGQMARYNVADLFSRFVKDIYALKLDKRSTGDEPSVQLYKMMLNGLAGKFAQRRRTWHVDPQIPAPDRWCYFWVQGPGPGRLRRCRSLDGVVSVEEAAGERRDSFPAITSAITSGGRCFLERLVGIAGRAETYYLDTDSLHVSKAGCLALDLAGACHDSRLGALKTVAAGQDAYYWGPKQYRVGNTWVSNVVRLSDRVSDTGHLLQEMRHGLEFTFAAPRLDTVYVRDQVVHCAQGSAWVGLEC